MPRFTEKIDFLVFQGWKIPDRLLADTLQFRPSCETGSDDREGLNTVEVSKQRLLELEAAIERRYLKAPLGASKTASIQNITASTERNKNEDAMEVDEKVLFMSIGHLIKEHM